MTKKLNELQFETLQKAIAWENHPKNPHPDSTAEIVDEIRIGWLHEDHILKNLKTGFDLCLRSYA